MLGYSPQFDLSHVLSPPRTSLLAKFPGAFEGLEKPLTEAIGTFQKRLLQVLQEDVQVGSLSLLYTHECYNACSLGAKQTPHTAC